MPTRTFEVESTGNVVHIIDGKPATFSVKLTNRIESREDLSELTPEECNYIRFGIFVVEGRTYYAFRDALKHDELKSAVGKDLGLNANDLTKIHYVFGQLEFDTDMKIDAVVLHELPEKKGIDSQEGICGLLNAINPDLISKRGVVVWYDYAARFNYFPREEGLRRFPQVS